MFRHFYYATAKNKSAQTVTKVYFYFYWLLELFDFYYVHKQFKV